LPINNVDVLNGSKLRVEFLFQPKYRGIKGCGLYHEDVLGIEHNISNSKQTDRKISRLSLVILFCAILLGIALRILYYRDLASDPVTFHPRVDAQFHHEWAIKLSSGHWLPDEPFFRAPAYPYFLGFLYKLFGPNPLYAAMVQQIIGLLTGLLIFWLGRILYHPIAGAIGALLYLVYPPVLFFEGDLQLPVLEMPLITLALIALLKAHNKPTFLNIFLSGCCLGLSSLVRPNFLLFGLFVSVMWFIKSFRQSWKNGLSHSALYLAGMAIAISPATIANLASGEFVLIATQGGINFYYGNNPRANGHIPAMAGSRGDWRGGMEDHRKIAEKETGHSMSASQVDRYYRSKAWEWIKSNPGKFISLLVRKIAFLIGPQELGNNRSMAFVFKYNSPWIKLIPVNWTTLAALGACGLLIVLSSNKNGFKVSLSFLLIYSASLLPFFITSRYRMPLIPVLSAMSGIAFVGAAKAIQSKNTILLIKLISIAVVSLIIFGIPFLPARQSIASGHLERFVAYYEDKDYDHAYTEADILVKKYPLFARGAGFIARGEANAAKGNAKEAEEDFMNVVRLFPNQIAGHLELAKLHQKMADPCAAASEYHKVLEYVPWHEEALQGFAAAQALCRIHETKENS